MARSKKILAIPEVSVVVATYNYGHYLPQALDSVRAQTYPNWEAIVVDDGSTDDTPSIMRQYATDSRIQYLRTENGGQPAAENKGIRASRGKYIAFLDADDIWVPEKIEKQLNLFAADPSPAIVYSCRLTIDPDGVAVEKIDNHFHRGRPLRQLFRNNFICFSSSMVKREVFDNIGSFNEACRHASDYEFWLRAARIYSFDYVDEPLVKYRKGHANLTSLGDRQLSHALRIMDDFIEKHPGEIPAKEVKIAYGETYLHMAQAVRSKSRMQSLPWFLRSLVHWPLCRETWSDFATLFMPEKLKSPLRRLVHPAITPSS